MQPELLYSLIGGYLIYMGIILRLKYKIYKEILKARYYKTEKLFKAIIRFSPKWVLYHSNLNDYEKNEIMLDALAMNVGVTTTSSKMTLRKIIWKMPDKAVFRWFTTLLLVICTITAQSQEVSLKGFYGGTTVSQEDTQDYDFETGIIAGITATTAFTSLYVEASTGYQSNDFNVLPSFKGTFVEVSAGWTTRENPAWRFSVGPYYRGAWSKTSKFHTYGPQVQIQYGPIFLKGQLGFYNHKSYTGYAAAFTVGASVNLKR